MNISIIRPIERSLTIILATVLISITVFGICLSLSCASNNEPEVSDGQTTVTLEELIQGVFEINPRPQVSYIIIGSVKQIDNRTLFIKRVDDVIVVADIDEGLNIETLDEFAEGNITKPMAFQNIMFGDTVELWVKIISDGSFEETRLLVNY